MKHLKSSFRDLHRLFEQSITVRDIAEPVVSFDQSYSAEQARKFMARRGFDVVGVRREGSIEGYICREDLEGGTVGDYVRELEYDSLLRQSDSLLLALEALRTRRWVFISFLGDPSGIITRGDLQKAPVRMWLFGLISLLEMQMLRLIHDREGDRDWWHGLLSPDRLASAKDIHKERQRRNEETDLADCLQFADKATIIRKIDSLFQLTGMKTRSEWNRVTSAVQKLRNNLAHANPLDSETWPQVAELTVVIEKILTGLECTQGVLAQE